MSLFGPKAINLAKLAVEGAYSQKQCVWGITLNTASRTGTLPEAKLVKTASLLRDTDYDPGPTPSPTLTGAAPVSLAPPPTNIHACARAEKHELPEPSP